MTEKLSHRTPPPVPMMHSMSSNKTGFSQPQADQRAQSAWSSLCYEALPKPHDTAGLFFSHGQSDAGQPAVGFHGGMHGNALDPMYEGLDVHMIGNGPMPQTSPFMYDYLPNTYGESTTSATSQLLSQSLLPPEDFQYDHVASPSADASDLPSIQSTKALPCTLPTLDNGAYDSLLGDLAGRLNIPMADVDLPLRDICQGYLSSYAANFHPHLPIMHLTTWHPSSSPSPLTLAMCSIGALYRMDRLRARRIHDLALRAAKNIPQLSRDTRQSPGSQNQQSPGNPTEFPLWYLQTRIMLSYFSIMSGEPERVSESMHNNGFYVFAYNHGLTHTSAQKPGVDAMSWPDWIEHESWNRALGAILILTTLSMVIYDVNPGLTVPRDLQIQPLATEELWSLLSPEQWQDEWLNQAEQRSQLGVRTLKEILADIMLGQSKSPGLYSVSSFSALVLVHAVVVHMWQRTQVSQALGKPWWSSAAAKSNDLVSAALLNSTMKSLARCELFIHGENGKGSQTEINLTDESSLSFSCGAVLNIAYTRLYRPLSAPVRFSLIDSDQSALHACVMSYVAEDLERGSQFLEVIAKSLTSLTLPAGAANMAARKAAPYHLGVEHAIAGWESALLVTKWTHHVEMDLLRKISIEPNELELFSDVQEFLVKAEYDLTESISVAAGVARTWSWFLKDVWLWGITPRMGSILEQLAKAFEQVRKTNRRQSIVAADFGQ
ncbi:hypothetical protein CC79DRAFT_1399653 [Sarocladium strictum]